MSLFNPLYEDCAGKLPSHPSCISETDLMSNIRASCVYQGQIRRGTLRDHVLRENRELENQENEFEALQGERNRR